MIEAERIDVISYRTKSHEIKINHLLNPHGFKSPDFSDFTWVNQERATIVPTHTEKYENQPAYMRTEDNRSGENFHLLVKDAPGQNFYATLSFTPNTSLRQFAVCGMALKDGNSDKFLTFGALYDTQYNIWGCRFNKHDSFGGDYKRSGYSAPIWNLLFIQVNGRRFFQVSADNLHYETVIDTAIDFTEVTQAGVFVGTNSDQNTVSAMTIHNFDMKAL